MKIAEQHTEKREFVDRLHRGRRAGEPVSRAVAHDPARVPPDTRAVPPPGVTDGGEVRQRAKRRVQVTGNHDKEGGERRCDDSPAPMSPWPDERPPSPRGGADRHCKNGRHREVEGNPGGNARHPPNCAKNHIPEMVVVDRLAREPRIGWRHGDSAHRGSEKCRVHRLFGARKVRGESPQPDASRERDGDQDECDGDAGNPVGIDGSAALNTEEGNPSGDAHDAQGDPKTKGRVDTAETG